MFNDVDDDNASITKSAMSSDVSLVVASMTGDILTLNFQSNQFGTATITLTGTSNGQTVDQIFTVTVSIANDPPVVANAITDVNVLEDAPDTTINLSNLFTDVDNDNSLDHEGGGFKRHVSGNGYSNGQHLDAGLPT